MTEDDKRKQKAMLLLEYQEAEESLAHLKERAYRMEETINEVRKWVSDSRSISIGYGHDESDRNQHIRGHQGEFRQAMNFDEILALMDEIEKQKETLGKLEQRKRDLGLK